MASSILPTLSSFCTFVGDDETGQFFCDKPVSATFPLLDLEHELFPTMFFGELNIGGSDGQCFTGLVEEL